jgi:tetratricopeptide (TPR) repeat protein
LEYEAATEAGMPRLVFLLGDDVEGPAALFRDETFGSRQTAFRRQLAEGGVTTATVTSPDQFETALLHALILLPRPGSQAEDPVGLQPGIPRESVRRAAPTTRAAVRLPPPPSCVDREELLAELGDALVAEPPSPVAVLGGPGIGKSTVCLTALHSAPVAQRFGPRRWFVRCDGATDAASLLNLVATQLGGLVEGDAGPLLARVTAVLDAGPSVLALDNLETPWAQDPIPVERLLATFTAAPGLVLIAALRGTARPGGVRWRTLPAVAPLPSADARTLFLTIAGDEFATDPELDQLLEAVDRVPLAVELLAHNAQGEPDLRGLVERWELERVGLLSRAGGHSQEVSVAASVELSMSSPLLTPNGRRLLSLLGQLPNGLAREDLNAVLPERAAAAATNVRQVGLAFDEADRLRTLAPIREHLAAAHPPAEHDLRRLVRHYCQLAADQGMRVGGARGTEAARRLSAELGNLGSLVVLAVERRQWDDAVPAALGLCNYACFTDAELPALMQAIHTEVRRHATDHHLAQLLEGLAELALVRSDPDTAEDLFTEALRLFERTVGVRGRADCTRGLGHIALDRWRLGVAEARYRQAQVLYRDAADAGQADCLARLGDIALRRIDYPLAQRRYEESKRLFQGFGDVVGEANSVQRLGDIAVALSDEQTAHQLYAQAVNLYRAVGFVRGEANCIAGLAEVASTHSDHHRARTHLEHALQLYHRVGDARGQANCLAQLADIAAACSDHGRARQHLELALAMFQQIHDPYPIAGVHMALAKLSEGSTRKHHLAAARAAWTEIDSSDLSHDLDQQFSLETRSHGRRLSFKR